MSITVFTGEHCAYCPMVKKFLTYKGVAFTEKSVENAENRSEAYKLSGAMTVPITLVENGDKKEVIIGYNLPRLSSALKS